jgi:hypothetical protein
VATKQTPEYRKAYYEANKERLLAYRKEQYYLHQDMHLSRAKRYYAGCKEKKNAKRRAASLLSRQELLPTGNKADAD